jgi:tRNA pseudouridine55 synthase
MPLHGWLILDKPLGLTSAQVVAACKRLLRPYIDKYFKIGHGGTLDPLATGVLPIAMGEATKLSGYTLNADKGYDFTICFGTATSTQDAEGEVIASSDVRPTLAQIEAVLPRFIGPIDQVPPAYSALKVDGKRAYARARAGEVVVMESRRITVHNLTLQPHAPSLPYPDPSPEGEGLVSLSLRCSKGTYVRSLARDIALSLGTVGYVSMLKRTKAGPFGLAQAISLDSFGQICARGDPSVALLPITAGLDDIPALAVSPDQAVALRQGRRFSGFPDHPGPMFAQCEGQPIALVTIVGGEVQVLRGLNIQQ